MPRVKISGLPKMFTGGFAIPNAVVDINTVTTTTTFPFIGPMPDDIGSNTNFPTINIPGINDRVDESTIERPPADPYASVYSNLYTEAQRQAAIGGRPTDRYGEGTTANDMMNIWGYGTKTKSKMDTNKCPDGFIKNYLGQCVPKAFGTFQNWTNTIGTGMMFGRALAENARSKRIESQLNKYGIPDYSMMAYSPTDRYGDYVDLTGDFNPRYTGFKSKGMYTDSFSPSTSVPKGQVGGQQLDDNFSRVSGDYEVQSAILPDPNADLPLFGSRSGNTGQIAPIQGQDFTGSDVTPASPDGAVLPVPAYSYWRVASGFGPRKAPTKGASSWHNGLDISVPANTELFSIKPGVVKTVNYSSKGGNQIVIYHDDGTRSGYAHLNEQLVKAGQRVDAGQKIGLSGGEKGHPGAGVSTGAHLHFTYGYQNGDLIDPSKVFNFNDYVSGRRPKGYSGNAPMQIRGNQRITVGVNPGDIDIASSHNNPLNLHYGKYARGYGGVLGSQDGGGNVAIFPDLQTGLTANWNLLYGPNYSDLTISEARNKWVKGDVNQLSSSTPHILKEMGSNKKLSDLTLEERKKLFKLFSKWESSKGYKLIKDLDFGYKYGGENSETMKVRIVGLPDEGLDKMAYGGQSGYGLDVGYQHLFNTMNQNPYEKGVSNTVTEEEETEDDPYVLEAEGGENYLTPQGEFKEIKGPRHSDPQQGVLLKGSQIPEKSFMWSDTRSARIGGKVLENFGKSGNTKKKYTPAELARPYGNEITKKRAILQNKYARPDDKRTAALQLPDLERKLAELALVQESNKGFPDGIPDIAMPYLGMQEGENMMAYGGMYLADKKSLPAFQVAGQRSFTLPGGSSVTATRVGTVDPRFKPYPNVADLYWAQGAPGSYGPGYTVSGGRPGGVTVDDILNNPNKYRTFHARMAGASPDEMRKAAEDLYRTGKMPGQYTAGTPDEYVYTEGAAPVPGGGDDPKPVTGEPPINNGLTTTTTTFVIPPRIDPNRFSPSNRKIPYGWTQQDRNNLTNAYMKAATIKKYHPYYGRLTAEIPRPVFPDWLAQAQQIQSTYTPYRRAIQEMGSRGDIANLTNLAGQQAAQTSGVIGQVNQVAAGMGTEADVRRANILNQTNAANLDNLQKAVAAENAYDAKFWGAMRGAMDTITRAKNQGISNASGLYATNVTESPYYYFNPRLQDLRFDNEQAAAAFRMQMEQQKGLSPSAGQNVGTLAKQLFDSGQFDWVNDPAKKQEYAIAEARRLLTANRVTTSTNPYNYAATTQRFSGYVPQSPYAGDGSDLYGSPY